MASKIENMDREELLKHIEKIEEKIKYYVLEVRQNLTISMEREEADRMTYFFLRRARYAFKQAMRLDEEKEEAENHLCSLGFGIDTKKSEENFE